jgi:endonuclease G
VRADFVEVRRTANFYVEPDTNSEALKHFDPAGRAEPIHLTMVGRKRSGYREVFDSAGQRGWIHGSRVKKFAGDAGNAIAAAMLSSHGVPGSLPGGFPRDAATGDEMLRLTNIGYVSGYSESKWNPLWVAHRIGTNRPHQCERLRRFVTDKRTESQVTHSDYNNSGYDRGHMAPSATIGHEFGCDAQNQTYLMTNITPQLPGLNQKAWAGLENVVEDVYATRLGGVWVVTGPIFDPDHLREMCNGVEVPLAFYKIVLRNKGGQLDALAVVLDQDTAPGTPVRRLLKSIDEIERRTGLDFFPELPDGAENLLESMVAADDDWQLDTALDTTFDGAPRPKCEKPPMPRDQPVDM